MKDRKMIVRLSFIFLNFVFIAHQIEPTEGAILRGRVPQRPPLPRFIDNRDDVSCDQLFFDSLVQIIF